ncbi:hypothetical protein EfmJHP35_02760 [Enterococcus faecium]|nr:hypothetical protein EfmJHP35_02760 [Enterococcus faecium]
MRWTKYRGLEKVATHTMLVFAAMNLKKLAKDESELEEVVAEEFIRSRKAYGSRKIKKPYQKRGIQISRRKISIKCNNFRECKIFCVNRKKEVPSVE